MQNTLTIKGRRSTPEQIAELIDTNNDVFLNGVRFAVTYRIDEHNMFENTQRQKARFMLLWGRGYKYAFCLPLHRTETRENERPR